MIEIGNVDSLRRRLARGKSLTFLVGAPFSWDQGKGVPTVDGFIDVVRKRVAQEGEAYAAALARRLGSATPAKRYQQAMAYVYDELGAEAVGEIVKTAVLRARYDGGRDFDSATQFDGSREDWYVTRGQLGLARWIKLQPARFGGAILTTNFDPLIRFALVEQHIAAHVNSIPLDGGITAAIRSSIEEVNVFHLHGYWRDSPTLHVAAQLEADRPQLHTSLQEHLNRTNLVVMAYSGWDDIVTSALAHAVSSANFHGEVTWCFYGDSPAELREQNSDLFGRLAPGINQGKIRFFCDVDCHTFFDELIEKLEIPAEVKTAKEDSPFPGWEIITSAYLTSLPPLTGAEAIRFFDGAVPTWRHASSALIPRLSHAEIVADRISAGLADESGCSMQLIRAAGGEGKSTALLQAAVQTLQAGTCTVVYRSSSEAPLNADTAQGLDPDKKWLIVADDAEGLVGELWESARRLHENGRANVFFLVAARDSDWRVVGGDQKRWSTVLNHLDDINIGGIAEPDAGLVVDAWAQQGDDGLRALRGEATREARIANLVRATRAQDVRHGDGSFFGGLLQTRFSPEALREHVVGLMDPLRGLEVEGGSGTLYDALVFIANCHAVGMPGLDRRVLAALCDLPEHRVSSDIVAVLGRELGAAESRGHILTRHRKVAEAIVVAAETSFGTNLEDVWTRLIEQTARLGRDGNVSRENHGPIIHAGTRLKRDLPHALDAARRGEIGVVAAEAAMEAMPEWSSTIIDLARALRFGRRHDDINQACELMAANVGKLSTTVDGAKNTRGYFYEWSTCAGNLNTRQGSIMAAWLAAFSLSDALKVELHLERAKLSCAGLGKAFELLLSGDPNEVFAKGRRAATEIGWRTNLDPRAASYLERFERESDDLGTPRPADLDEAIAWLANAAHAAYRELEDPNLQSLHKGGYLAFTRLRQAVAD